LSIIIEYINKHVYFTLFILYVGIASTFSTFSPQAQILSLWPPAGIALAGCLILGRRFLPAVFVGSLLFNLGAQIYSNDALSLSMMLAAVAIALGSTLQVWVNYKILQSKQFNLLSNPSYSQISFFILIALLSCSISAVIGNTALQAASNEITQTFHLSDNVLVWWIGDFLGVILVTPMLLSIMGVNTNTGARGALIKGLGVPLILIVAIFQTAQQYTEEKAVIDTAHDFSLKAKVAENSLKHHIIIYLDALKQLEIALSQRPDIGNDEFAQIVAKLTDNLPGIKAMSWNPLIEQKDVASFERDSQIHIDPGFTVKGTPLLPTDPLVIVQLIAPLEGNKAAQGFNVFSNEARKKSMLLSRISRIATATDTIQLVQSDQKESGFLIFSPVFRSTNLNNDILNGSESLSGFAVGVFLVSEIIKQSLSDDLINFIDIYIYENANTSDEVYGNQEILETQSSTTGLNHVFDLNFANHLWTFNLNLSATETLGLQVNKSLYPLVAQAILGALSVFIILSIYGRNAELRNLVKLRTLELEKANTALERFAFYDALTKLPNRRLFLDRAQHAIVLAERNQTKLALLFLDLNGFKQVNDNFGHDVGDQLLKKVAMQFAAVLRDGDTIARLGGDEFILLMENDPNIEDIATVTQRLTSCLIHPLEVNGELLSTSTSIGVATYPSDGATINDLIRAADTAMYAAKKSPTNIYFYSGKIHSTKPSNSSR